MGQKAKTQTNKKEAVKSKRSKSALPNTGYNVLLSSTKNVVKNTSNFKGSFWFGSYSGHTKKIKSLWSITTNPTRRSDLQVDHHLTMRMLKVN